MRIIKKIFQPGIHQRKRTCLIFLIIFSCLFLLKNHTAAENSIINLTKDQEKEYKETQNKIKELEEKAQTYQQIIDIKRKQQLTLENQISLIETEAERLGAEIDLNKGKIDELNLQINSLRDQIGEKEETIIAQKKILAQLLQKYYEYNRETVFSVLFGENKFASFTSEEDHLTQTGEKIKQMLGNIESLKNKLEEEKEEAENKKNEITDLYLDQQEKNSELENSKDQKIVLVAQTRGEESRYQKLLARVEAQKQELLGDIDELYSANKEEINSLLASLAKPASGLASTSWYYSQKDSRWGNMRIGQSNSLVKDYGCALTSVAMIFTNYGEATTPASLARQKIYDWDLIVWPEGKNIELVKNTNHGGVNWSEIDRELNASHPVIVFIKAKSGGAGHYVIIHHKSGNDYVVHDPYFGSNIYLSSSIKLLSALYKTSIPKSSIDQMILYRK